MITLTFQADDALIVKKIQHGTVKTQSFIDGKPGHIDNKDIKRLGYKTTHNYVIALIEQGYIIED